MLILVYLWSSLALAADCPRAAGIAWALSTGFGQPRLQACISSLEQAAIQHRAPSEAERAFLRRFYRTLAVGGRVSLVARQSGRMMGHYLRGSGADLRLRPRIFRRSDKVQAQMDALRAQVERAGCPDGATYRAGPFAMAPVPEGRLRDLWIADSVFGLYYTGTLSVTAESRRGGRCQLRWEAELPWRWPTFDELTARYGGPLRGERFPLPNPRGLATGGRYTLYVSNGLGGELARLGMAAPFRAHASWTERLPAQVP